MGLIWCVIVGWFCFGVAKGLHNRFVLPEGQQGSNNAKCPVSFSHLVQDMGRAVKLMGTPNSMNGSLVLVSVINSKLQGIRKWRKNH